VAEKAVQPIIKKIKKVTGHGAHGGVWKLAYADFVTAMMAFFLLMWLLNVTSEEMKSGIAQYFSPEAVSTSSNGSGDVFFGLTISVDQPMEAQSIGTAVIVPLPEANRSGQGGGAAGETGTQKGTADAGAAGNEAGGPGAAAVVVGQATAGQATASGSSGNGTGSAAGNAGPNGTAAGGENQNQSQTQFQLPSPTQPKDGQPQAGTQPQGPGSDTANQAKRDNNDAIAKDLRETLNAALRDAPAGGITAENVKVTTEAEGVMIEIGDTPNAAMFEIGKSVLLPTSTQFIQKLAEVLKSRPEPIMIYGHTDGRQYPDTAAFTNWELSANRANEARRSLIAAGLRSERIVRVAANADRFLKDTQNPLAAENRRIQILLRT